MMRIRLSDALDLPHGLSSAARVIALDVRSTIDRASLFGPFDPRECVRYANAPAVYAAWRRRRAEWASVLVATDARVINDLSPITPGGAAWN